MIIRLNCRGGAVLHFDIPDWHAGRADERVMFNGELYNLVTPAIAPLPTYVPLPPARRLKAEWTCQAPQGANA